ncbi:MAG TPA: cyclase family protein [Ktedonobacterales bacterium]
MAQRIIDLSVPIDTETYGPPSTKVRLHLEPHLRGPNFWIANTVSMSLHTGSHVDAPSHVFQQGETMDRLTVADLVARPVIIRLPDVGESQPVTAAHLRQKPVHEGDIVLLNTGWSDRMWGTFPDYYTRSPFLEPEAARYLADARIRAVGFDFFEEYAARLPAFTSDDFVVHQTLLGAGVTLLEQMTNLSSLSDGALFIAAPIKIRGVEGAPARFLALEDA